MVHIWNLTILTLLDILSISGNKRYFINFHHLNSTLGETLCTVRGINCLSADVEIFTLLQFSHIIVVVIFSKSLRKFINLTAKRSTIIKRFIDEIQEYIFKFQHIFKFHVHCQTAHIIMSFPVIRLSLPYNATTLFSQASQNTITNLRLTFHSNVKLSDVCFYSS